MVLPISKNFQIMLDAQQAWFLTKEWLEAEKEAELNLKSGKVRKFKTMEELIKDLDK